MKSRIKIGIDTDNQPIIEVSYEESEDVRDLLVYRFIEAFGFNSNVAVVKIFDTLPGPGNTTDCKEVRIKPVRQTSLKSTSDDECSLWINADLSFDIIPATGQCSASELPTKLPSIDRP